MKRHTVLRQTLAAAAVAYHSKQASATSLIVVGTTAGGAAFGLDPWLFAIGGLCGAIVWGLRPEVPRRVSAAHFAVTVLLAGIAAPSLAGAVAGLKTELPAGGLYTLRVLIGLGSHEYFMAVLLALGWQPVLPWAWEKLKSKLAPKPAGGN